MPSRNGTRTRDPIIDRLQTVKMSERDRDHARDLLEHADRMADAIVRVARFVRELATPLRRVGQR